MDTEIKSIISFSLFLIMFQGGGCSVIAQNYGVVPGHFEKIDTTFFSNGMIKEIEYIINGRVLHRRTFDTQGQIITQVDYNEKGAVSGLNIAWHSNGQIASMGTFVNGLPVGKHQWWNIDGGIRSVAICENGDCVKTEYYNSGEIHKIEYSKGIIPWYLEERYKNGQIIFIDSLDIYPRTYIEYHTSGRIFRKTTKNRGGAFINEYRMWSDDGILLEEGQFQDHQGFRYIKSGEWRYYGQDGVLKSIKRFENDSLVHETNF